ncbi:MAG: DNA/RNA nuclease SfsA [Acidobacteriota bacterium]
MAAARLIPARFLFRPNRFIIEADLENGRRVRCHLADPGRLAELLRPGAVLRLRPAPAGIRRRTSYSAVLVRAPDPPHAWVSLDTSLPNRLAATLLRQGRVGGIGRGWRVRPEVRHHHSRFDFELSRPGGRRLLVEVKSVTLVEAGTARFPDAPTARGARHLHELARFVASGGEALLLFVVQRHDARRVRANTATDPAFAAALGEARRAGVRIRAVRYRLEASGRAICMGAVPVRVAS